MLDKKTLPIIILLIVLILFFWQILDFLGIYTAPERVPQTQEQTTDTVADYASTPGNTIPENATQPAPGSIDLAEMEIVADTLPVDTIQITTESYIALLSTKGGGLVSLKLRDHEYRDGDPIEMLSD